MNTTKGAHTEPQTSRVFTVRLETGERLIYISDGAISYAEAGKRLRAKFNRSGKFIR